MNTFNLYERPCGRVVLTADEEPKSTFIRLVSAPNWKAARAKIDDHEFFHDPGHGMYVTPRPGAYQRLRDYHARIAAYRTRELMLFAGINDTAIRPKRNKREALEV